MDSGNNYTTEGITLESIQLLPNLHHEHYHEYIERIICKQPKYSHNNAYQLAKEIRFPISFNL